MLRRTKRDTALLSRGDWLPHNYTVYLLYTIL